MIDGVYDGTSEASVVCRLARAATDGIFRNTDLGVNVAPQQPRSDLYDYRKQVRYFEHPELIHSLGLNWAAYPSHFGLQGYVFAAIDLIDPLPRNMRIPFYHLLASLFTAGMLVWMAAILRSKFGWAAFIGFLLPTAIEPMFSGLAPNLYWFAGSWLLPIPFGMLLADEDDAHRKRVLLVLLFLAFMVRFLSGYEFTSTIIPLAARCRLPSDRERKAGPVPACHQKCKLGRRRRGHGLHGRGDDPCGQAGRLHRFRAKGRQPHDRRCPLSPGPTDFRKI